MEAHRLEAAMTGAQHACHAAMHRGRQPALARPNMLGSSERTLTGPLLSLGGSSLFIHFSRAPSCST